MNHDNFPCVLAAKPEVKKKLRLDIPENLGLRALESRGQGLGFRVQGRV